MSPNSPGSTHTMGSNGTVVMYVTYLASCGWDMGGTQWESAGADASQVTNSHSRSGERLVCARMDEVVE